MKIKKNILFLLSFVFLFSSNCFLYSMENNKKDLSKKLIKACWFNDIDLAKDLIKKGVDVDAKDGDDYTPLIRACHFDDTRVAQFLIVKGADVNAKNRKNQTPLFFTCQNDNQGLLKVLMKNGADILCLDKDENFKKKFERELKNALTLEKLIKDLAKIDSDKDYELKKEKIKQILVFMLDSKTPIYSKQSALLQLVKCYNNKKKISLITHKELLSCFNQILFNNRFFESDDFIDVLECAILTNTKDKSNRPILNAAVLCGCNNNKIGKILSKFFEMGHFGNNSGLFKKWLKEYYAHVVKKFLTIIKRPFSTDQEKAENDFIDAITLAKERNRQKVFKLLMDYSIHSDYLRKSGTKKRSLPDEIVANIMSF